ncbi:YciI family protein [Spirillospora sp. CA-294931]|uniref:YciI family protein n=1 Tax=Spirillospora sp. CA-294931 TaxID=3240042 RepID=UPI003D92707F
MKYVLVISDDGTVPLGHEEIERLPAHVAWMDYMDRAGVTLLGGARLRPGGDSTTVRTRDGQVLISDGPFVETKEQIGGFAMIECDDLDMAVEVASRHPFAAHGAVEVRPVWE